MIRPVALTAVMLSVGCTYVPPPIPLVATPGDAEVLAGRWLGEYEGEGVTPRGGRISFELIAGEDHAHGEVLMIPTGANRPYERYRDGEPPSTGREAPAPPEPLRVRFVRAVNGDVNGALDTYWDPDRQCQVWTTFRGRIRGDTIDGTFASTYSRPLAETKGRWRVVRTR